jgi:hypothetical protein
MPDGAASPPVQHQPEQFQALLRRRSRSGRPGRTCASRTGAGRTGAGRTGAGRTGTSRTACAGSSSRTRVTRCGRPSRSGSPRRGAVLGSFARLLRSRLLVVTCGERPGDRQQQDGEQR